MQMLATAPAPRPGADVRLRLARRLAFVLFAAAALALLAAPARAQEADKVIDLWPWAEQVLAVIGPALVAVAIWFVKRLTAVAGLDLEDAHRQAIAEGLRFAIAGAVKLAKERGQDTLKIEVQNDIARAAARGLLEVYPDAARYLKLSPERTERWAFKALGLPEWQPLLAPEPLPVVLESGQPVAPPSAPSA